MHKKTFLLFSLFLCFSPLLQASCWLAEIKGGYFYPQEEELRDIYTGGAFVEGELNYTLTPCYLAWASGGYFRKNGSSLGFHEPTRIEVIPIGLGLKYRYPVDCQSCPYDLYLGAGLQYFFLRIHNDSEFVKENVRDNGLGGIVKVGALFCLYNDIFLDLFVQYAGKRMHFHDTDEGRIERFDIDVGGWFFGAGLGFEF